MPLFQITGQTAIKILFKAILHSILKREGYIRQKISMIEIIGSSNLNLYSRQMKTKLDEE